MSIRKASNEREWSEGARMMRGYFGWVVVDDDDDGVGELVVTAKVTFLPSSLPPSLPPSFPPVEEINI